MLLEEPELAVVLDHELSPDSRALELRHVRAVRAA
jgi:hypothetical protein